MDKVGIGEAQAAGRAIMDQAREMARSGDFCSWRLIEIELRFMRGIRAAARCFTDPDFREELDQLCRQARPPEAFTPSRPAITAPAAVPAAPAVALPAMPMPSPPLPAASHLAAPLPAAEAPRTERSGLYHPPAAPARRAAPRSAEPAAPIASRLDTPLQSRSPRPSPPRPTKYRPV